MNRPRCVPLVAAGLAAGWILAQALGWPALAAAVAVLAIAATAAAVPQRRRTKVLRALVPVLAPLAALLAWLLLAAPTGPGVLAALLALLLLTAPVAPLIYAATFRPTEEEDGEPGGGRP